MKILWLASWYPSEVALFNGDFIQRHAEAASLCNEIEVIHVVKDTKGRVTKNTKKEVRKRDKLTERIVYYFSRFQHLPFAGKLFSERKYRRVFKQQISEYIQANGRPDLVHVHVAMKAGVLALWLKRKYNLPYVLTEHSSVFLPEAELQVKDFPFYYRLATRRVLRNAEAITVVSHHLRNALQSFAPKKNYVVLPNVVNTAVFHPKPKTVNPDCRFLHVSSLDYAKNPETILTALSLVRKIHGRFSLAVFGPPSAAVKERAKELGIADFVTFYGEVPQKQLAAFMQQADALILFSRYETFGCVVIEANACGTPVVVSDIPAMKEIVKDRLNGMIVQSNAAALAAALLLFIEKKVEFDRFAIAGDATEKYGYRKIGAALSDFYQTVLNGRFGPQ